MPRTLFANIAFAIGILVLLAAVFIFVAEVYALPETHPFASVAFPIIFVTALPEVPLQTITQQLGFPVVLPLLTIASAVASIALQEPARMLQVISILFVFTAIGFYISIRYLLPA